MRRWTLAIAALAIAAAPSRAPLHAQRLGPAPKRPKLGTAADTNDAQAYLAFGLRYVDSAPDDAAAAFYWAARIDPGLAEPLYGRRAALLLANHGLLLEYMTTDGDRPSKAMRQLDSLQLRAAMLNPFLHRRLELQLLQEYIRQDVERRNPGISNEVSRVELDHEIMLWLKNAGAYTRGRMAYASGDFDRALALYAEAMQQTKEKAGLHVERGRIFGARAQSDSAIAEFRQAIDELRKRDAKKVVVLYNSKAVLEESVGMLLEQQDSVAAAPAAYGRALEEDMAFWPAHVHLALLAVSARDTATAVSELELATQLAKDEPYVHLLAGSSLTMMGRAMEGLEELKKAAELEPYYATPHVSIARLYENSGFRDEALAAYQAFLARASRVDPQRAFAEQRVAALKSAAAP